MPKDAHVDDCVYISREIFTLLHNGMPHKAFSLYLYSLTCHDENEEISFSVRSLARKMGWSKSSTSKSIRWLLTNTIPGTTQPFLHLETKSLNAPSVYRVSPAFHLHPEEYRKTEYKELMGDAE